MTGPDETPEGSRPVRTGDAAVDEVIAAVEQLEDRPVEEHAAVFETTQERLREALETHQADTHPDQA